MKNRLRIACFFLTLILALTLAAGPSPAQEAAVDYSDPANWLSAPADPELAVDVFYLYSDSWGRGGTGSLAVSYIDDQGMRLMAAEMLASQAGAFETVGNIFAPFYRQADRGDFLNASHEERLALLTVPIADSTAAFDHYFRNFNKGRPYILVAHSQGSLAMLSGLMSTYLKTNPEAKKLLVAAYCLGYSVTGDYLAANPHLKFAQRSDDLGVIISYNTEAPGLKEANPVVLPRSVAINPVLWTRSERPAKADQSQGANLAVFEGDDPAPAFADAKVNLKRGVVECSTADPKQYNAGDSFPAGAFHSGDFAFYYYDLRRNAGERAAAFLSRMEFEKR